LAAYLHTSGSGQSNGSGREGHAIGPYLGASPDPEWRAAQIAAGRIRALYRSYTSRRFVVGFSTLGSVWNALTATLIYLLLWIGTLPLWLFGVPALVLPALINGWYNDRLFRFDALCEHATRDEYRALTRQYRSSWYGLGVVAAVIQMVPIVNLISPVYSGLSFIHFGLARLTQLRTAHVAVVLPSRAR